MSIASNFPAIKPTLLLDFSNTEELDSRITFTRASTATYYGTETAKAEENLLLQSQTFNSGSWTTVNLTLTADAATAPDGTTTAETLTDDTVSQAHVCPQVVTTTAGLVYTLSFFLKASTNNFAVVTLSSATIQNYITAVADLSTGAITETSTGTSATFTSSSITSVGSGWYRLVITGSCTAGFSRVETGLASAATGNTFATNGRVTYTGTGTSIFAWGAQLEQRSAVTAYTPTTTQPITNYIPQLLTAASGVARFDHNPTTFESLGLLIEESRTNLVTYSEQFDNAAWTKTRSSVTANTIVSPDGTLDGDALIEDTSTNTHSITQAFSFVSGTTYTFSIYVKAAQRTAVRFLFPASAFTSNLTANFDISTGAWRTSSPGPSAGLTLSSTSVGNGWYRISASATATASSLTTILIYLLDSAANTGSYTGDGTSGIYIWGAQLEAGTFATSYIPTVASQVTRAADAASMTGTNFSSWYNQAEGTFYAQFIPASSSFGSNKNLFLSSDGTVNNYAGLRYTDSGARPTLSVVVAGTAQAAMPTGTMVAGTSSKMAGAYKVNDFATSRDAGTVGTDTSGTVPVVTQAEIGMLAGAGFGTQTISKLAYYPLRVTNAQLQALTS